MITQIGFKNLKGRTDNVELSEGNLIYGRNFTGKTTIVDAIKLALLGYHPALDRTHRGTMELASDTPMSVVAEIRNGEARHLVGHEWHRIGETVRSRTFGPPPGVIPETPIAALDAQDYFSRSDKGKIDLIFANATIAAQAGFVADTLGLLADLTDKETATVICELAGGSAARSDQQWLEDAIAGAERRRSEAAAGIRRFQGAVQTKTVLAQPEERLPENIADLIGKKRQELEKALQALAALKADKPPATTAQLETDRRTLAAFKARLTTKDIEIGKAVDRMGALLAHDDCPMCGTPGAVWREKAKEMGTAEREALMQERGQIEREMYHTSESIKAQVEAIETKAKRWAARDKKKQLNQEETVAELREEIAALERKVRAKADAEARDSDHRVATEALKKAQADEHRFKVAKGALQGVKANMVGRVFEPILATANAFTEGLLRAPLAFNDGDLGYWRDFVEDGGTWVSHRTFSGTEEAIAFCGFQAALAAHAPVKLAILDELGRLDKPNKEKLLANVAKALRAGTIDQFIGLDTEAPANSWDFRLIER